MSAPSLYRRHRPRSFDDVVGQEHVVRTLSNAIEQDKVHHAYLFVGSRGTGKTSMAKILAACLNCQGDPNLPETERLPGPTTHPCGRCEACRSIAEATSMDVVEMDAASNNSVDDIRDLRDSVAFAPVGGRHKVYILDEAHMLSNAAWNAFLKTLEEPPPRTIFVLATTEANKVLPTVVDRCHRFDFHRPTPVQLSRVLDRVAQQESIAIGPEAVALVARHATGSFRDALGTLEQLVTYAGEDITTDDVLSVLGVADAELLFRAFDAVGAGDAAATLQVAAELSAQGRDLTQVTRDVEAHARALLLVLMTGDLPDELRISPERDDRTVAQARTLSGATVIRVIDLVSAALSAGRDGADPRTQLELLLVRAALPQIDPQAKALAARIARLEQAAQGAAPPPVPAIPVATPQPPAGPQPPAAPQQPVQPRPPAAPAPSGGPSGPAAPPSPAGSGTSAAAPQHRDEGPRTSATAVATAPAPRVDPSPIPPRGDVGQGPAGDLTPGTFAPRPESPPRADVTPQAPAAPPSADAPAPPSAPSADRPPSAEHATPAPGPADQAWPAPAQHAADAAPPAQAPAAAAGPGHDRGPAPSAPDPQDGGPATDARAFGDPPPTYEAPPTYDPAPSYDAPHVPQEPPASAHAEVPAPLAPAPGGAPIGITVGDVDEQLPGIAEQMGGAVRAALSQARAVSVKGADLVLGVPAGKATAARTINREDAKEKIAAQLEELLGVRFVIQAAEQAGVEAPQEQLLPEDEVVRRVMTEFEAEEVGDGASGVASPGTEAEDPTSAPETTTPGES